MSEKGANPVAPLAMREFVTLIAFLMALTALSVDVMLPVLPDILSTYGIADANQQQFMITAYLGAFAFGHIFAGPLSDRLGRRPVLLAGLGIYLAGSVVAVFAESYAMLLAARAIQGFGAAGPRVVAVAVVRDRFVGRGMSEVMSFVMTVFIMLPVIAPAIGALIAAIGSWHYVFGFLLVFGIGTFLWTLLRLPETNPRAGPEARPAVPIATAIVTIATSAQTIGYMLALGFVFGCLLTYISITQQIFADIYGIVDWFPFVFAIVAGTMIISSVVNGRMVQTIGMRRLSHGAVLALTGLSAVAYAANLVFGGLPLSVLVGFMSIAFFLIGLILPNFNALAMEPLGAIAGTGSSFVGFFMTGMGAVLGGLAGSFYGGTLSPLLGGYLTYSATVLGIVLITERGRLMEQTVQPLRT